MAEKKNPSRAEQAVSEVKKNSGSTNSKSGSRSSGKKSSQKNSSSGRNRPATKAEKAASGSRIPASLIYIALFVLLAILAINPEGAVLRLLKSVLLGILGQAGFYFAIPALLYLFIINTFGRRTAVTMRSVCTILFVLLCGCIFHLMVQTQGMATGFQLIPDLYLSGVDGISGGILCGGLALLMKWACGRWVSLLICVLSAILCLLGAMDITIPSLIRAIANRPREEEDEAQTYVDPAALMVNHIANKRIEKKRQHNARLETQCEESAQHETQPNAAAINAKPKSKRAKATMEQQPELELAADTGGTPARAAGMMNTIDLDIEAPVFGAARKSRDVIQEEEILTGGSAPMPELNLDEDVAPPSFAMEKEEIPKVKPMPKAVMEPIAEKPAEKKKEKVSAKDTETSAQQVAEEIEKNQSTQQPMYCFPPMDLLKRPVRSSADGTEEMRENSRRLNETLASFNIDAHIINVTRGPSVTRYEVELDKGVRLNKLTGCADDIALSLGASGVRIAAVPGKISVVGIEVPNRTVTTVSLRDVLDSTEFSGAKSKCSVGLGKSIDGNCVVGNIAKMPHLLIAGTTGSGKSVCMNSIIISLLYKAGPEDVKLIMVDPKMVELGIYNGIPHLLIPVVTDPKKAAGSLQWAVTEMLRRYKMMSDLGVRDLESYNSIVTAEEDGQKLPSVVIIIDELADLMMVAAKEVEDSICRIAQMGRAAGMHLIIATQRPSANVITGLMKANIPSRIAFSVASAMESRIILDTMGAEKLVGKGDMLYAPIGSGKPLRVQGCFVTDTEVEAVAGYVKENYVADYNQEVLKEIEKQAAQTGKKPGGAGEPAPSQEELDGDEMLPAAVDIILETGQASVSMLQRRLKLGYARAARIVDEMEEKGIVGPFQGSKPRSILITKEQWEARKNGGEEQLAFGDLEDSAVPEELL